MTATSKQTNWILRGRDKWSGYHTADPVKYGDVCLSDTILSLKTALPASCLSHRKCFMECKSELLCITKKSQTSERDLSLLSPPYSQIHLESVTSGVLKGGGVSTSPNFWSFNNALLNSQFCGKYIHNNLIWTWVSLIFKLSRTLD
jgi:hypothetical protein